MLFTERVDGQFHIYTAAVPAPQERPGFVATLVIKRKSDTGLDEPEAFRDVALTDDFVWSDEMQALQCALRLAHSIIEREPERLMSGSGPACEARA